MTERNGVFHDRAGRDWDATIVKIIEHPISVPQAVRALYWRVPRMLSEPPARETPMESGVAPGIADVSGKASPAPLSTSARMADLNAGASPVVS